MPSDRSQSLKDRAGEDQLPHSRAKAKLLPARDVAHL
jgi:hypothetical protein